MLKRGARRVFSKGPGPKRQVGHPKPVVTLRPPKDLEDYLNEGFSKGNPKTDVIIAALRMMRDASLAMGPEWWEVERRAKVENSSHGAVLGQLALQAMLLERKAPKKDPQK